ncbi:hypothetical protein RRG08_023955 [Elysia crispata]|uniref:Brain tumor protein n=1 Tax=Elysia crispata TaxID=231223 RepID=A0AAE1D225_9GAST|nr:hypothetical protein RRG08_023955 [Elysia crispata]
MYTPWGSNLLDDNRGTGHRNRRVPPLGRYQQSYYHHQQQQQHSSSNNLRRSPSVAIGPAQLEQQSMAMVRHSPATQAPGRSAWTSAPTSSTPPEAAEETITHTPTANMHGAIGEHRRSSRSSSVSSGGSTNSAEGAATTTSEASNNLRSTQSGLSRLSLVAASSTSAAPSSLANSVPKPPNGGGTQDAAATEHVGTNGAAASASSVSPPSSVALAVGLGLHVDQNAELADGRPQVQPASESLDPKTTPTSMGVEPTISSPFGFFMGGSQSTMQSMQSGMDFGNFSASDPPRQGRPIIGTNSSGPFSPGMPHATEVDLYRLIGDNYPSSQFSSVQPESSSMGLPFFDNFHNNSMNMASDSDLGAVGGYPMSSSSMSYPSMGGAYSNFQPYVNSGGSNQFSHNYFGGSSQHLQVRGRNGGFYPSSHTGYSNAPGYYSPTRQSLDYFGSSHGTFQPFSSNDFSLPPPAPHPWRSGPYSNNPGMPESVLKRITCPGCSKQYKWPHVLQCLHVFCFQCICAKYCSLEKTVTCPSCSRKTPVPDGPCSLRLDYQGCRYMRDIKVFPFGCTGCTRDQEAVTCCTTCMAYLCSECQHGHNAIHQFQGHVLNPIGKIGKSKISGDYQPFCPKHLEEQTKFCVTCDTMMCELCVKEHAHPDGSNGNNCHSLSEVHDIVIERMKTWNEDSSIKAKDTSEMSKRVPLLLQSMDNKKRAIRKQIEEYSDYCKHVVDQNRAAAFESLDKAHSQMECHVNSWSKSVSGIEAELVNLSSFNIRTTEQGSVADVLSLLPMMEEEYKRIMAGYSDVIKDQEGIKVDLKFDPNYKESHDVLNSNFMTISFVVNGIEHRVTPSMGGGTHRGDSGRGRNFVDYTSNNDNPDCNYQRWSAAPDSMSISTWNNGPERERKGGTYIPQLNRSRVKTSYVHMFGEYGRGEYAFTEPSGQAYLNDGSYVICDTNNHRIVYYNAKHEYVRTIGQPPNLPPVAEDQESRNGPRGKGFTRQEGYLYFPNRVAICPLTQNIVATERPPSHDIQIFTKEGNFVRCFGGNILQHPRGVTVDEEGIIIVVECKVMKLVMFTQEGNFIVSHSVSKELEFPNDVAARERKIFISDNRGHCVQVFNYEADFLYKIGNESITYFPIGVSINYLNQVVVTDNHNTFNITVFDITGNVLHIFESVSKLAQCHNVAVHPSSLELMLTTKDCSVYFFNYDPNVPHPQTPPITRAQGGNNSSRRASRINSIMACNPTGASASFY